MGENMRAENLAVTLGIVALVTSGAAPADEFVSIDRFVPHVSTVPANEGERVGLFVREKLSLASADRLEGGSAAEGRVVLFVHGVSVPSIPDFDLDYKDYSWMEYLAEAGFDTFAMDQTGYGHSPQPMMADPCNMNLNDQSVLAANPISRGCTRSYERTLTSSQTDWDEIDTVVDFIRELRGVERVSLLGWSLGGLRTGGYAARHPDKVDKLVLYAPFYQRESPSAAPENYPEPGPVMALQTRETLMGNRWGANVACENQVEPGIVDVVWRTIMGYDAYGSAWLPGEGVMRVRTASYWGWNAASAADIRTPTLIMIGEQDGLLAGADALYEDLTGTENKVLVHMQCATHFAVWEASQYKFMHEASKEWLTSGRYEGHTDGSYTVGFDKKAR